MTDFGITLYYSIISMDSTAEKARTNVPFKCVSIDGVYYYLQLQYEYS